MSEEGRGGELIGERGWAGGIELLREPLLSMRR